MELIAPPGTRASYSQAGYNLVGRIVEKVTGLTYERVVASVLGLAASVLNFTGDLIGPVPRLRARAAGAGGVTVVENHFHGMVADREQVVAAVQRGLREYQRRNGNPGF